MKQGANGRRTRGRSGGRKQVPLKTQNFDSNGPDVRIRGDANHVYEKYVTLARDSHAAGDRVIAESYLQHAEHYYRIMNDDMDPSPESTSDDTARAGERAESDQAQPQGGANGSDGGANGSDGGAKAGANGRGRTSRRGTRQERRERHERTERDSQPEAPETPKTEAAGPTPDSAAGATADTPAGGTDHRSTKQRPDGFGRLPGSARGGREDGADTRGGDDTASDAAAETAAAPSESDSATGSGESGAAEAQDETQAEGEAAPRKSPRRAPSRTRRSPAARGDSPTAPRRRKAADRTVETESPEGAGTPRGSDKDPNGSGGDGTD